MKRNKCIYCGSEQNITKSDIIPDCITKAKFVNSNVCFVHNCLTNSKFENKFANYFSYFRNQLGFLNRRYPDKIVPFKADIYANDILIRKNFKFYSLRDFCNKYVDFDKDGSVVKIKLSHLPDCVNKIKNPLISYRCNIDILSLLFSDTTIKTVAKICFEFHCWNNRITDKKERYRNIINYILGESGSVCPVEIIEDELFENELVNSFGYIEGAHALLEYSYDNRRYVLFSLFGIVWYKTFICDDFESCFQNQKMFLYLLDEGIRTKESNAIAAECNFKTGSVGPIKTNFFIPPHSIKIPGKKSYNQQMFKKYDLKMCRLINGSIITIRQINIFYKMLEKINIKSAKLEDLYWICKFAENVKIMAMNVFFIISKIDFNLLDDEKIFLKTFDDKYKILLNNPNFIKDIFLKNDFIVSVIEGMDKFQKSILFTIK